MITNIFLGLILGVIITSFIILNNKLLKITNILATMTEILNNEVSTTTTTCELFKKLVERFNKRILIDTEYFEIIKNLIDKNKVEIYNNQQLLYNLPVKLETFIAEENNNIITLLKSKFKNLDEGNEVVFNRINSTDSDIQNLIIAEHRLTRRQIEKQAKISSKIVSRKKQSNNTQK